MASNTVAPIADLTYRNYDGPILPPANRWWAIAKMTMRLAMKKRGFWIFAGLSGIWYLILIILFWAIDTFGQSISTGQKNPILTQFIWKDQFVHGFSIGQLPLFVLALFIGTGAIANDNRANALLVYLSKPCTRLDYIVGKWIGVFLPIAGVAFGSMGLFYLYGLLSFREYGFITQDPLLLPKLVFVAVISGALHASLSLGISSMFNQGRIAGATYAGIYFLTQFFTKAMQISHITIVRSGETVPDYIDRLYYASVDGVQIAMAKLILGTSGSPLVPGLNSGGSPFGNPGRPRPQRPAVVPGGLTVPSPPLELFLPIFFGLCAIGVTIAWSRVKAVEVVG